MTVIKLARDLYKSQAVSNTSAAAGVIWEREMLRLGIGASLFRLPEASFHRSLDELRVITSHLRWIRPRPRLPRMAMPTDRSALAWGWSREDGDHVEGWPIRIQHPYQEHGAMAGEPSARENQTGSCGP